MQKPLQPGARRSPVLVWLFSGCEVAPDAPDCTWARILTQYERARGRSESMHVGLAVGFLDAAGVVALEGWEFGANVGRASGMCPLMASAQPSADTPVRLVVRNAMYLQISRTLANEFLDNFCYAGISPFAPIPAQYSGLPRAGVPYPSLHSILRRACVNLVPCALMLVAAPRAAVTTQGGAPSRFHDIDEQLRGFHAEAQCAQFAMMPLLSMVAAQSADCTEQLSFADQARIRETARGGVGLHPHSVLTLLRSMPAFTRIVGRDHITLDGSPVALASVEIDNANFGRMLPDLARWQRFRLAL